MAITAAVAVTKSRQPAGLSRGLSPLTLPSPPCTRRASSFVCPFLEYQFRWPFLSQGSPDIFSSCPLRAVVLKDRVVRCSTQREWGLSEREAPFLHPGSKSFLWFKICSSSTLLRTFRWTVAITEFVAQCGVLEFIWSESGSGMKLLFVPAKPLGFSFLTFEGFKLGKNFVSPKPLILSTEYSRGKLSQWQWYK